MSQISGEHLLKDVLREHPETQKVMARRGMKCAGCKGLAGERVRQAAENHGLPLDQFLHELKSACRPSRASGSNDEPSSR